MRIIFLNTWCAKTGKVFFDYIASSSNSVDIFALTEIPPDLFSELKSLLPGFNGYYDEGLFDITMGVTYGQAVFVRNNLDVKPLNRVFTFKNTPTDVGFASPFIIKNNLGSFCLVNVHGKAKPGNKFDTPVRLKQSENIIESIKDIRHPTIIGGDFNLYPNTKSVKMFEEAGYRNLIAGFGIKNTRNEISWKEFNKKQYFADYVFTSPDVMVKSFEVPYVEISDHLPLILEFEIRF